MTSLTMFADGSLPMGLLIGVTSALALKSLARVLASDTTRAYFHTAQIVFSILRKETETETLREEPKEIEKSIDYSHLKNVYEELYQRAAYYAAPVKDGVWVESVGLGWDDLYNAAPDWDSKPLRRLVEEGVVTGLWFHVEAMPETEVFARRGAVRTRVATYMINSEPLAAQNAISVAMKDIEDRMLANPST